MGIFFLVLTILLTNLVFCDQIENGWNGIKPLKTHRAAVEKILGEAKPVSPGYFSYNRDDVFVHVTYATGPCEEDRLGRGQYDVPKDTVLRFYIVMKKELRLNDLRFQSEKYKRVADREIADLTHLYNDEDGIHIEVVNSDNIDFVVKIRFRPSKKNEAELKCSSLKSPTEHKALLDIGSSLKPITD